MLRGGPSCVDVPELLRVLDFAAPPPPVGGRPPTRAPPTAGSATRCPSRVPARRAIYHGPGQARRARHRCPDHAVHGEGEAAVERCTAARWSTLPRGAAVFLAATDTPARC
ncbi:hypothetical protein HBB16_01730 [Pseudonocardia sp. MCCB 268]|nr:hypothetical protein [Pseudonocardia cytotoxica]